MICNASFFYEKRQFTHQSQIFNKFHLGDYYLKLRAIKEVVTGTMASLTESFIMFTMSTISDNERNARTKSYDRDAEKKVRKKKLRSVFRLYQATKHKAFTFVSVEKGLETLPINRCI